jgi:hypothetical protein
MDGFQVADQLCRLADPPAVVLTSSRDGADYGRCIQVCSASGLVPKAELSGAASRLFLSVTGTAAWLYFGPRLSRGIERLILTSDYENHPAVATALDCCQLVVHLPA